MKKENNLNIVDWIKSNFMHLHSLDQNDSFDDLEPLRDLIGSAKVIALGENSHFIKEFCQIRIRTFSISATNS